MWLFVGLGNPGKEYEKTRHNMGFACIDAFCQNRFSLSVEKKGFSALYASVRFGTETVLFSETADIYESVWKQRAGNRRFL